MHVTSKETQAIIVQPVGLLRLLGVIFYDTLLLICALIFAALLAYPITHAEVTRGYQLYLFLVCFFYFAWPWVKGGQTLGMKTWHVKMETLTGEPLTWKHAFLRFSTAFISWGCLGLGFLWIVFDNQQRSWHDMYSETRLIHVKKKK